MAPPSSILSFSFVVLLLSSSSALAFNITKILEAHPDYSTFNSLLSQTKLAGEINGRSTITVLAVNNAAAGGLSGLPEEEQKRILSVHVVLDYYDEEKLAKLSKKSTILTTMYQSTGTAVNQQGFLNITKDTKSGEVRVGSAVPGAGLTATIGKEVMTQPFNISVLQVSGVIHPDGIESVNATAAPPTKAAAAPKGDAADSPASAPGSEENEGEGPALSPADTPADAPADGDVLSESPTPAGAAPADADSPGSSDAAGTTDATSPGPASEDAADSSASRSVASLLAVVVGIISMVVA
ncbi:hypothetical protein H6P81_000336 [Aristolochia fimbriata]|uniref:FAS1 domain-containing protein n=1 Tax=Aristolochia fimbriata TaxID=158543 RepID=A0AAV7F432_ARIFI|nr:hypothetical protein H6P81_000336 [Aristolochia fimbriata]